MVQRFTYYASMTMPCRLGILVLCLATTLLMSCATPEVKARKDWEKEVTQILAAEKGRFQVCGKKLTASAKTTAITIKMTFRVNPAGALETLWLDESGQWDQGFYDCMFNVVDQLNFPSIDDQTALEVEQSVIFRRRG
jgi:hypothetical protein